MQNAQIQTMPAAAFIQCAACSLGKTGVAERHRFHPHARTASHAPDSNEEDYALYLPAVHKNDRPKDT